MGDGKKEGRERFALNVERLRRRRRVSMAELAERSELDQGTIEELLGCQIEPRLDTIYLLAGALGVEPGELFEGVAWVPAEGGGRYQVDD